MKLYVDKLPKGCESCPFYLKDHCVIDNISFYCPLEEGTIKVLSLSDHDKQVRKEVCWEIWKEFEQRLMNKTKDMPVINVGNMINSVLDQIGEKE